MTLISNTVRQRLTDGLFVAERKPREHPLGLFRFAIRLESAVFTNRLAELLKAIDALNNPDVSWVGLSGPFGIGKTSLARALAECVPAERAIWLETPGDAEQFALHLAKAFHQPDINLFEAIQSINQPTLVVLNRADALLTSQGRWQLPAQHRPVFQALLQNKHCRLLWCGEKLPPDDISRPVPLVLDALPKAAVKALLERTLAPYPEALHSRLLQLTQGHPWRIRLLWRLLKTRQPVSVLQTVLTSRGELEERLLAHYAADWSADIRTLLALLMQSPYPLSLSQLRYGLLAACPGSMLEADQTIEHSPLTPFITRFIPVQMAHSRQAFSDFALYQLAPLARPWLKQQHLPNQDGFRGLGAIWQWGLDNPGSAAHIGTRRLRKAWQDYQKGLSTTEIPKPIEFVEHSLPALRQQLQAAITQGQVSTQLTLLEAMALHYQQQAQWQEARKTLEHTLWLADLTNQPEWTTRAKVGLQTLFQQIKD